MKLEPSILNHVVEEIEAIAIENVKHWRELQIQTYWGAGEALRKASGDQKIGITELVALCAKDDRLTRIKMGHASLWFGVQLFDKYPDFERVYDTPHGENISVTKLKALMSGKEEVAKEPEDTEIAKNFIKKHGYDKAQRIAKVILSL